MTKEELKKEAEKYVNNRPIFGEIGEGYSRRQVEQAYIDSAEPREKRIAELEAEVTRLRNENLDIINKYTRFAETDRRTIAELEAQIEKMKSDVMANIKWADKNCDNMWQKLVKMWNQWEIKEK